LAKQSLISHLGEEKIQKFINFCLGYMSKLTLPVKRGNFIEFRNGLINVCPVGRSCSQAEREQFNTYDQEHSVRKQFIQELERNFGADSPDALGLVYSIGGQISFEQIYFFGDKTQPGGNDHEIFSDPRTIGKSVQNPSDTLRQLAGLGF
jgi:phosphomannomutase